MGSWAADLGYRGFYLTGINNSPTESDADPGLYEFNDSVVHEIRGTLRYRFN